MKKEYEEQKKILSDIEESLQRYGKEYGFVIAVANRSLEPHIVYTKNTTNGFALAIVQHIEKRLMAEYASEEKS